MKTRSKLLAGLLAAFLALAGLACEVEDFEGDPLEDDPMIEDEGGVDDGLDDGAEDDWGDDAGDEGADS